MCVYSCAFIDLCKCVSTKVCIYIYICMYCVCGFVYDLIIYICMYMCLCKNICI